MRVFAATCFLLFITSMLSCSQRPAAASPTGESRIQLDQAHNILENDAGAPAYEVDACATLVIEEADYKITVPQGFDVPGPNSVQVIHAESGSLFRVAWKPGKPLSINADSLETIFHGRYRPRHHCRSEDQPHADVGWHRQSSF
jgi:hypothetical protein